ncbi:hypothetical protein SDC9_152474 [bioreactor metagenome]|uniref:Uncharacterized protein n=1 Tax=bioreactor metagenome TaxID=1076179 RepID=A0A645EXR8_9ZZZZ
MSMERISIIILCLIVWGQLYWLNLISNKVKKLFVLIEDLNIDITAYETVKMNAQLNKEESKINKVGSWIK